MGAFGWVRSPASGDPQRATAAAAGTPAGLTHTPPVPAHRHGPRARLRDWFTARLPRADSHRLGQRNLYILPTRSGWGFAFTLGVLLLASVNYQLNLGYALTFLLCGAALVSMHQTHANLRGLTLRLRPPAAVFAGDPATLEVVLDNPARRERYAVGLGVYGLGPAALAWVDVPAQGSALARLRVDAAARGRHALPALRVETHFPLGLFRTWSVWRPAAVLLVYPKPESPAPALPGAASAGAGTPVGRQTSGDGFDGVRAWRRGDGLNRVVWKKVAKSGEWISRDLAASSAQTVQLSWSAAALPDTEARLSRLAAWVLAAEAQQRTYAVDIPGLRLAEGCGEAQRRAALEALALWGPQYPSHPTATTAAR